MWLAGIWSPTRPASGSPDLPEAELVDTAEQLERAYDAKPGSSRSTFPTRESILRVLEECPDELLELRATLLLEHRLAPTLRRSASYTNRDAPARARMNHSRPPSERLCK